MIPSLKPVSIIISPIKIELKPYKISSSCKINIFFLVLQKFFLNAILAVNCCVSLLFGLVVSSEKNEKI